MPLTTIQQRDAPCPASKAPRPAAALAPCASCSPPRYISSRCTGGSTTGPVTDGATMARPKSVGRARDAGRGEAESPETVLPLTPATFHILLALADAERHGYGIMQEVAERTDGAVRLGPGTLYGSLKRLLEAGWVDESDERADPALDDERRRYYRLTPFGRSVARAEAKRLDAVVRAARRKRLIGLEPA